jgi:NAD(P)-dependent dehydrogenase (short-subunit alcohol dehydrogenase family)
MRRVLITGANRGLGLGLAQWHAARGDQVFATCRTPADAPALHALVSPGGVHVSALDVSDPASVEAARTKFAEHSDALDVLYNNAGITSRGEDPLDADVLRAVLDVNVVGAMRVASAFAEPLARGTNPVLLNVSSQLASLTEAPRDWGHPQYNISKAALNMMSCTTANTWRPRGVVVLVVHPGWVRTDMGGDQAPVTPEDAAESLAALVDRSTMEDTGKFFTYEGKEHPW